jgi:hypothetical protein
MAFLQMANMPQHVGVNEWINNSSTSIKCTLSNALSDQNGENGNNVLQKLN